MNHRSALLWNAFSKNGRGVRIKTSLGKIYNCLPIKVTQKIPPQDLISPVDYLGEREIKKYVQGALAKDGVTMETVTKMFFKKREAYMAEMEVRVIIPFVENYRSMKLKEKDGKRILESKIDPKDFIESIYFDSKIPKVEFEIFKSCLRDQHGFKKPIRISSIHRKPRAIPIRG